MGKRIAEKTKTIKPEKIENRSTVLWGKTSWRGREVGRIGRTMEEDTTTFPVFLGVRSIYVRALLQD